MTNRQLPNHLQFELHIIETIYNGNKEFYPRFIDPRYQGGKNIEKLTPTQWKKVSKYLTRILRPFYGYQYTIKPEYLKAGVYKII